MTTFLRFGDLYINEAHIGSVDLDGKKYLRHVRIGKSEWGGEYEPAIVITMAVSDPERVPEQHYITGAQMERARGPLTAHLNRNAQVIDSGHGLGMGES